MDELWRTTEAHNRLSVRLEALEDRMARPWIPEDSKGLPESARETNFCGLCKSCLEHPNKVAEARRDRRIGWNAVYECSQKSGGRQLRRGTQ